VAAGFLASVWTGDVELCHDDDETLCVNDYGMMVIVVKLICSEWQ